MSITCSLKNLLIRSTALAGFALLSSYGAADAASIVINTPGQPGQTLNTGDKLMVTSTGSIMTSAASGVKASAVTATSVTNNGTISGVAGIGVLNAGALTGGITNTGMIAGRSAAAIAVTGSSSVSHGVNNSGTVRGSRDGILIGTNSHISGGLANNTTGTFFGSNGAVITNKSTVSGGITNSGFIQGFSGGLVISSGSAVSGGVRNNFSGVISGFQTGLRIGGGAAGGSVVSGGVNNSGIIFGGGNGIFVGSGSAVSGGITNNGLAGVSGGNAGVFVSNSSVSGGITNKSGGQISGQRTGIEIGAQAKITGGITNAGQISGSAAGVQNFGTISGAAAGLAVKSNGTVSGGVVNMGTISGAHTGIFVAPGSKISGGITDGGLISGAATGIKNQGTITGFSTAIRIRGGTVTGRTSGSGLVNSGLISGQRVYGVALRSGSAVTGGITNTAGGTISGAAGIGLSNGSTSGGITNAGKIMVHSGSGIGLFEHCTVFGGISNSGTIEGGSILVRGSSVVEGAISNTGLIKGAIGIGYFSDVTGGIVNKAGATISASQGIVVVSHSSVSGGIVNNGLIKAFTNGINVSTGSTLAGGIRNTGTVSGGIKINGGRTATVISGGIVNSGTINANDAGINLGTNSMVSGGITNNAGGRISGGLGGISIGTSSTLSGGITNKSGGTISGGIGVDRFAKLVGGIVDSGVITGGIGNSGIISGAAKAVAIRGSSNLSGIIVNTGVISGANTGIYVASGAKITGGGLINNGLITGSTAGIRNQGTISSTLTGIRIEALGNLSGGVSGSGLLNSGLIKGQTLGFVVRSSAVVTGAIANSGTISAVAKGVVIKGGDPSGVLIHGGSDLTGGLNNSGVIRGSTGIFVSRAHISGGLVNSGTITGTGGNAIVFHDLTNTVALTINGGAINGNVTDNNPGTGFSTVAVDGDFTTNGNFTVSSLAVAAHKTLTINSGNSVNLYTMPASAAAAVFNFGVTSASSFGSINVANSAVNFTGSKITVDVQGGGSGLVNGAVLQIGSGNSTVLGIRNLDSKTAVADNSALWNFSVGGGSITGGSDNNLDLFVTQNKNAVVSQNMPVLGALEGAGGSSGASGSALQSAFTNVSAASTGAQLNQLLASMAPSVNGVPQMTTQDFAGRTMSLTGDRMEALLASGSPQLIQAYNESDAVSSSLGLQSARFGGLSVGADVTRGATGNNSDFQATVYGNQEMAGNAYLRGMAGFVSSDSSTARRDVGGVSGLTATASFDSQDYVARMEAGKRYYAGDAVITPLLTLDWMHYAPTTYTEMGAGNADLNVHQSALDSFDVGVGVKTSWAYDVGEGAKFAPSIHAGYSYDLIDESVSATSQFAAGGPSFTTEGSPLGRGRLSFGTGLAYTTSSDLNFRLGYDVDARTSYVSQVASLRAALKF